MLNMRAFVEHTLICVNFFGVLGIQPQTLRIALYTPTYAIESPAPQYNPHRALHSLNTEYGGKEEKCKQQ